MPIIEISSLTHPGVEIFSTLTEAQLRNRLEPDKGLFIAESPKVIKVALDAGYEPLALLCEHKHIYGDAAEIIERCGDIPVYTSGRELLAELTGYVLTRVFFVPCAVRFRRVWRTSAGEPGVLWLLTGWWIPPISGPSSVRQQLLAWMPCC